MEANQHDFIELLVQSGVLQFGDFVGKSGRRMPYFIDAGRYRTGAQIARLGRCYAHAIHARLGAGFDLLFGPAYKGIPLVVTTAIALHERHGRDVGFCFDRKEAKDHGEGGLLVGTRPKDGDRVLIVEDVVTAGTAVRHSIELLRASAAVELVGLVVGVDRMERGRGDKSALRELADDFGIDAFAIATIDDVVEQLRGREIDGRKVIDQEALDRIAAYRARYGAS
jgi:orotate phosphoribosyltransferase